MTGETVTLVYEGPQDAVEVQVPGTGTWLVFERGTPVENVPAVLAYGGRAEVVVLDGEPLGSELAGLLVQGVEELDPDTGAMRLTQPWWRVVDQPKPRSTKPPAAAEEDS